MAEIWPLQHYLFILMLLQRSLWTRLLPSFFLPARSHNFCPRSNSHMYNCKSRGASVSDPPPPSARLFSFSQLDVHRGLLSENEQKGPELIEASQTKEPQGSIHILVLFQWWSNYKYIHLRRNKLLHVSITKGWYSNKMQKGFSISHIVEFLWERKVLRLMKPLNNS